MQTTYLNWIMAVNSILKGRGYNVTSTPFASTDSMRIWGNGVAPSVAVAVLFPRNPLRVTH